ncbi:unnamed protein product [Closterium sp. Naga37s-1]|nr:unnamed protein product [Closterium sp. Naga37s-1]
MNEGGAAPWNRTPSPTSFLHTLAPPTVVLALSRTRQPVPPPPHTQQQPREGRGRAEGGAALAHGGHHIPTTSPPIVALAEGKVTREVRAADSRWGGGEEEVQRSAAGAVTGGRSDCRCTTGEQSRKRVTRRGHDGERGGDERRRGRWQGLQVLLAQLSRLALVCVTVATGAGRRRCRCWSWSFAAGGWFDGGSVGSQAGGSFGG